MIDAGLFVEENASSDEKSKAADEDAPNSKKFLRFKFYLFYLRENEADN